MKFFCQTLLLLCIAFGLVAAETKPTTEDSQREKRGFIGVPHGGPLLSGHIGKSGHFFDPLSHDVVHQSAAHATAAAAAAARAAQISKAAQVAQAVAYDDSSLAEKTTAAVKAAENTYSAANDLVKDLGTVLSEAEAVAAHAWESQEAAKAVQAAQNSMVYQAQRAADALSKQQYFSLSELHAAQAAAAKAQAAASKAFAVAKAKGASGYGAGVHDTY